MYNEIFNLKKYINYDPIRFYNYKFFNFMRGLLPSILPQKQKNNSLLPLLLETTFPEHFISFFF